MNKKKIGFCSIYFKGSKTHLISLQIIVKEQRMYVINYIVNFLRKIIEAQFNSTATVTEKLHIG